MMKVKKVITVLLAGVIVICITGTNVKAEGLLQTGNRGTTVTQLQVKLNNAGYSAGQADGIFGSKTRNAVISYQSSHGLVTDGIVGY